MKKVAVLLLVLVFVFSSFVSVEAKREPLVVVMVPAEAFWGENVTIEVQVHNLTKKDHLNYTLIVPAGVASKVETSGGKARQNKQGEWVVTWNNVHLTRGQTFVRKTITMTLVVGSGEQNLKVLQVKQGKKTLSESWILAKEHLPANFQLIANVGDKTFQHSKEYVEFVAVNRGPGSGAVDWTINFSGLVYSDVKLWRNGQEVEVEKTADGWVYHLLSAKINPGGNAWAGFMVTYSNQVSGLVQAITVTNGSDLIQAFEVNVKVPALEWAVMAPSLALLNTPFTLTLTAHNPSQVALPFDVDTDFFYACTDRSLFPSSYPVLAYNGRGDGRHIEFNWAGEVQSGQTATWTFELKSGSYPCDSSLFELRDNLSSDKQLWLHNLRVVLQ